MSEATPNTEEKIKTAARRVFMEKGFDGTTSRDIAEAAGMNIALTNYYFRSKEKLFRMIFEDARQKFFHETDAVLLQPIGLREKIPQFIEVSFELFVTNPNLPIFLLSELSRHPELLSIKDRCENPAVQFFFAQVRQAAAAGEIRPVLPQHVFQLLLANVQFMFLSWPAAREWPDFDRLTKQEFMNNHRLLITDMIMGYLFTS